MYLNYENALKETGSKTHKTCLERMLKFSHRIIDFKAGRDSRDQ